VESVAARLDTDTNEIVVRIVCDINEQDTKSLFPPPAPPPEELIGELVRRGLIAKLSFSGITGLMYVDLAVNPPTGGAITAVVDAETGAPVVPIEASLLSEIADTLGTIANNLAKVDFPGIAAETKKLLVNLNSLAGNLDLQGTLGRIGAAADSVNSLAADTNLREALQRLNESSGELKQLLAGLREGVPAVQADLQKSLSDLAGAINAISVTAEQYRALVGPVDGVAVEAGQTLVSLRRAAESIEQLVDYLERNPGALLRGRGDDDAGAGGRGSNSRP
jgi:paraquat-inducible protein B